MRNVICLSLLTVLAMASCKKNQIPVDALLYSEQVNAQQLHGIRLGDGVPLNIQVSVRWTIEDPRAFTQQFISAKRFDSLILRPREFELSTQVANTFNDVDKVFSDQRDQFIGSIKDKLINELGEDGILIKDVIVSHIEFPALFTQAKEKLGMQEQELALIESEKIISLEKSKASEQKAKANGNVAIVNAKMDGDVESINAETEKLRRMNSVAKAETESQLAEMRAKSEKDRLIQMADAEAARNKKLFEVDLQKQEQLKDLDLKKQTDLNQLALQKQKDLDLLALNKEKDLAGLCASNPQYANFLISKELASKVQIAVLPSGEDGGIFQSMLQQSFSTKTKN